LKERMKAYGFSQKELFTIPVNGGIE